MARFSGPERIRKMAEIDEYRKEGMAAVAACEKAGVNHSNYYNWKAQEKAKDAAKDESKNAAPDESRSLSVSGDRRSNGYVFKNSEFSDREKFPPTLPEAHAEIRRLRWVLEGVRAEYFSVKALDPVTFQPTP